ncbi:MAG TPA: mechanosensitive ion channel family protein [Thermodesulfobacteriota bacterium]|nr:mechanosensitive ion channel family protein [Thermodesulfobacteriota bacterium]
MDAPRTSEVVGALRRLVTDPLGLLADAGRAMLGWLDLVLLVVVVLVVVRVAVGVVGWLIERVTLPERLRLVEIEPKQLFTLKQFARSAAAYTIYFLAFVFLLGRFGFDPSPFLVGAGGLVAIAIGFGSQGLVQDLVSGLFILLERQYAVGDFVEIGGVSGFVEGVGIRVTRIRDVTGALRIIPNRTVSTVGNYPRGYMEATVDIFPADAAALGAVEEIAAQVGRRLDQELDVILAPPRISRPLPEGAPHPFVRAVVRLLPLQQWAVDRDLVGRLKAALEARGIALEPPGIRVVYQCDRVAFYNSLNLLKARWGEGGARGTAG